jgi:hypothetical protein
MAEFKRRWKWEVWLIIGGPVAALAIGWWLTR